MVTRLNEIAKRYLGKLRGGVLGETSGKLHGADGLPDWRGFLADSKTWGDALKRAESGPKVLIPTSVGGLSAATILEGMLGVALTLRGANVRFLLCDAMLPACLHVHLGKVKRTEVVTQDLLRKEVCPGCINRGRSVYESIGLPVSYYSDFITQAEVDDIRRFSEGIPLDDIKAYRRNEVAIGEHALAGTLRFFAMGNLPATAEAASVLRRYLQAALITEAVTTKLRARYQPEAAVFHHGIYVPQGIIGEVARRDGIRVANWQVAYRKKCFIFSHGDSYHHTLIEEPAKTWEGIDWNPALEQQTTNYLQSRWTGSNDWIWFHDQPENDRNAIAKEIGLDFTKPTISLLTNVYWDAQLHFKANAFSDMLDWLLQTIRYFADRPDLQLVVRIHPAEVRGAIPSRQPLLQEIADAFPVLPPNVFVVPPESQISTYALCSSSDSVIIYGTKTGVELTAMGIPVVVAGEAWIRNKGLTTDASSPEDYFSILDRLPMNGRLSEAVVERARKYAFHFFFRRFVPIDFMTPSSGGVPYQMAIDSVEDLLPGKDRGLDVICDGILNGTEFVYPAERYVGEAV